MNKHKVFFDFGYYETLGLVTVGIMTLGIMALGILALGVLVLLPNCCDKLVKFYETHEMIGDGLIGSVNTHMTRMESSIAIEELDESFIENIEIVEDPKVEEPLCQLTEVEQLKLDRSKEQREIETLKDEFRDLRNSFE